MIWFDMNDIGEIDLYQTTTTHSKAEIYAYLFWCTEYIGSGDSELNVIQVSLRLMVPSKSSWIRWRLIQSATCYTYKVLRWTVWMVFIESSQIKKKSLK